ncbi:hypothetical protein G6F40_012974 [Rhizopus arrhizus]|nr:hypothetical protein G6F40_012974 [Rhizopus arrhizus]
MAAGIQLRRALATAGVGVAATGVVVAQVADIDGELSARSDRRAQRTGLFSDGGGLPATGRATVGDGHVVEGAGAGQLLGCVDHLGLIAVQADDGQITTRGDVGEAVLQPIGADPHVAAGIDHGVVARRDHHVFHRGTGGNAGLLVAAGLLRVTLHVDQHRVGIVVVRIGDELHAGSAAGAVGGVVVERVGHVLHRRCARAARAQIAERILRTRAQLVGVVAVVGTADVVDRDRAILHVQAFARGARAVHAATRERVGAGVAGQPDDRLADLLAIRGDIRRVFKDVGRIEIVDLVRLVVRGGAEIAIGVVAVLEPAGLLQPDRRMHGGDLLHNYVVADVVHRQRGQVQVAADLDRGTEVVHLLRTTNHSQPVQCAADGGIAVAEDQALAAVGQCANAQVQALACGDGAGPSHTTDVGRQMRPLPMLSMLPAVIWVTLPSSSP